MEPAAWGLIGNQRPSPILIDFDRFDIVPPWGLPGADRVGQPAGAPNARRTEGRSMECWGITAALAPWLAIPEVRNAWPHG